MQKVSYQKNHHAWLGAAWKIAAFACYAGLDGIARYLSGGSGGQISPLPVCEIVFFQDFIAFFILLPWYFKNVNRWKVRNLSIHMTRGVFSGVAVIAWYFALFYLPLADAVALSVIGPVIGVFIANLVLKEKLNLIRIALVGISFIVALLTMHTFEVVTNHQTSSYGILFVLVAAICFAIAKITTRMLAQKGQDAKILTLSLLVFIIPVSLIPALTDWVPVEAAHLIWLLMAGILTICAIYCVSRALVFAEVTFLAPFDLFRFLFNTIVGYFAFTELPTLWTLIFMALTLACIAWQIKRTTPVTNNA